MPCKTFYSRFSTTALKQDMPTRMLEAHSKVKTVVNSYNELVWFSNMSMPLLRCLPNRHQT